MGFASKLATNFISRESADDDTVLGAMVADPRLIERPLVETEKGVRLCRPPERIEEIL